MQNFILIHTEANASVNQTFYITKMKAVNLSGQLKNFLRNEPAKETRIMLAQKKKCSRKSLSFPGSPLSAKTSDVKCISWKYVLKFLPPFNQSLQN